MNVGNEHRNRSAVPVGGAVWGCLHPDVLWDCLKAETRSSLRRQEEELQGL